MPPNGPRLSAEEIATLRGWIDSGCDWPDGVELSEPRTFAIVHLPTTFPGNIQPQDS